MLMPYYRFNIKQYFEISLILRAWWNVPRRQQVMNDGYGWLFFSFTIITIISRIRKACTFRCMYISMCSAADCDRWKPIAFRGRREHYITLTRLEGVQPVEFIIIFFLLSFFMNAHKYNPSFYINHLHLGYRRCDRRHVHEWDVIVRISTTTDVPASFLWYRRILACSCRPKAPCCSRRDYNQRN